MLKLTQPYDRPIEEDVMKNTVARLIAKVTYLNVILTVIVVTLVLLFAQGFGIFEVGKAHAKEIMGVRIESMEGLVNMDYQVCRRVFYSEEDKKRYYEQKNRESEQMKRKDPILYYAAVCFVPLLFIVISIVGFIKEGYNIGNVIGIIIGILLLLVFLSM